MITVIIPTFNAAAYIRSTIESVRKQTYTSWSLIIVDDHSTDDTWEIIRFYCELDSRISAIRLAENFGRPAGPRNIGAKAARTEWLAFLDADDIWHKDKLSIQLDQAKKFDLDLICSRMADFTGALPSSDTDILSIPECERIGFLKEISKNRVPTSSVLVKRSTLFSFGGFNEDPRYKAIEDYDLWLRMSAANVKIGKCKLTLLNYRVLPNSISRNKRNHFKKVAWLIFSTLKIQRPLLIPLYPFLIFSYITYSVYYRLISKSL